jgi:hypothetical protein
MFQLQRLYRIECYKKIIMNDKQVRILKEAVMDYFKTLSQHSCGEPEEYHDNIQSRSPVIHPSFESKKYRALLLH